MTRTRISVPWLPADQGVYIEQQDLEFVGHSREKFYRETFLEVIERQQIKVTSQLTSCITQWSNFIVKAHGNSVFIRDGSGYNFSVRSGFGLAILRIGLSSGQENSHSG